MKFPPFLVMLCLAGALGACASNLSGETYSRAETGMVQRVETGTVVSLLQAPR